MSTSTDTAGAPGTAVADQPITKVSIIVSKGSLEGIYPALILANGARVFGRKPAPAWSTACGIAT